MKKDDQCCFDFSRTLVALRCHGSSHAVSRLTLAVAGIKLEDDRDGGNRSHTVSRFFLLLVPCLLRDATGHRDGFGDDVSHTSLSVVAACSLSASRRKMGIVMFFW